MMYNALKSKGIARALFGQLNRTSWLTGFAPPIQLGSHLFASGPALLWYEDGGFTLFVVYAIAGSIFEFDQQPGCAVITHEGYTFEQPLAGTGHLLNSLRLVLTSSSLSFGRVGLEERNIPLVVSSVVPDALGTRNTVELVHAWLESLCLAKLDEFLVKLKENIALSDIGHAAARQVVRVGKREIDIWSEAHRAIQYAGGCRVLLGNECTVELQVEIPDGYKVNDQAPFFMESTTGDNITFDPDQAN